MFSKLGGIFSGLPLRHVENANARLEIRRDESQAKDRKKDQGEETEYTPIPWEDVSYVSIASLKIFLETMLPQKEIPAHAQAHEATTTLNQRATHAYQAIGRAGHDSNIQQTPPGNPASENAVSADFSEADFNRIRLYMNDLTELERRGVTELAMQRSATFLDSLAAAITEARQFL